MKKKYVFFMLMLVMGTFLFAEIPAVVKSVKGKVEIRVPGGKWKKAKQGMKIAKGYYISTGFRSQAVIVLGTSQVIVKQLTRMELAKLIEKEGTVSTSLNLRVGRVRAHVKTANGLKQRFTLKSPISTAAVRGTEFEFDGRNLTVYEGTVAFTNPLGQGRLVPAGIGSMMTGSGLPLSGEDMVTLLTRINPSTITIPDNIDISDILSLLSGLTNVSIILNWGDSGEVGLPDLPVE